jgi:hypothetical protein
MTTVQMAAAQARLHARAIAGADVARHHRRRADVDGEGAG